MNEISSIIKIDYIGPSRIQYSGIPAKNYTLTNVTSTILQKEYPIDCVKTVLQPEKSEKDEEHNC